MDNWRVYVRAGEQHWACDHILLKNNIDNNINNKVKSINKYSIIHAFSRIKTISNVETKLYFEWMGSRRQIITDGVFQHKNKYKAIEEITPTFSHLHFE